jgi:hypothetical protein
LGEQLYRGEQLHSGEHLRRNEHRIAIARELYRAEGTAPQARESVDSQSGQIAGAAQLVFPHSSASR